MTYAPVHKSTRSQKHGNSDNLATDVLQENNHKATDTHADSAANQGTQALNKDQNESRDSSSNNDHVHPDDPYDDPEHADTHDSDDSGKLNKDQNEAIEPANMDSSSNNDQIDPDEPNNDPEHADTQDSDDSGDTTTMPHLEGDTHSSIEGRFLNSQSDNPDNSEPALPQLSDWKPIQDHKRRRNSEYTLSHSNKDAALNTWKWFIRSNHQPPGQYTLDLAHFFYRCFKLRNDLSGSCSEGQGD